MDKIVIEWVMVNRNLQCRTRHYAVVEMLLALGWKIQVNAGWRQQKEKTNAQIN